MTTVPADILDRAVVGSGLDESPGDRPPTLRDQLAADKPTLLVFLRHFGCLFCREAVKDLRVAAEAADGNGGDRRRYPRVAFVHMGTPDAGARFLARYWPAAPGISDPDQRLYEAFHLPRGGVGQMFAPRVWSCGMRAWKKGHRVGRPVGDPWQMPGFFLLDPPAIPGGDAPVRWSHVPAHAGDHPDFAALADHAELVTG